MRFPVLLLAVAVTIGVAAPAYATGGLICRTAGPRVVEVSLGFGHVPGSPLILTRLRDAGRAVPVSPAQWWLDNQEVRVVLVSPTALSQELFLRAKRKGANYDGSLWRSGQRRWVRCREDG